MKKLTRQQATEEAEEIVDQVRSFFAGHPHVVQGLALAELLATWLAGSFIGNDTAGTAKFRADLLEMHMDAVNKLIPIVEKQILANLRKDAW